MGRLRLIELAKLTRSPAALTAAYRASIPLQEKGWIHFPAPSWDKPAFAVMDGEKCVGVLNFSEDQDYMSVSIDFAFAASGYPTAFMMMLGALRKKYAGSEFRYITFDHHADNEAMAKAARALSLSPVSHRYRMPIERLDGGKMRVMKEGEAA